MEELTSSPEDATQESCLSALSVSPSHKRKSWSTHESLRSVDAVEKSASTLTASVEFPEFRSELWPGPRASLGHQKGREASSASGWYPYHTAPTLQCLRADCSWESHVQNKRFTVKTSEIWWFLLYDLFLQDPAVIFTSAEYLRVCVRLEAVHTSKPQSDWGFPNKREEGGWVIDFPVIFSCNNVQELQLLQPWNSSPEWIHTYLYLVDIFIHRPPWFYHLPTLKQTLLACTIDSCFLD